MTLGDLKVRNKNSMAVCTFNIAKPNPRRAEGIIKELLASIDMENVVVCLQESGRWQHLNGKVFGDHFAFGSSRSDCMILLPTIFVPLAKRISTGPRHVLLKLESGGTIFQLVSAHLIWESMLDGELEAIDTMDSILLATCESSSPQGLTL